MKNEKLNSFTVGINKIALSSNDDKWMQPIDLLESCIWNKQSIKSGKEKIERYNIIQRCLTCKKCHNRRHTGT